MQLYHYTQEKIISWKEIQQKREVKTHGKKTFNSSFY